MTNPNTGSTMSISSSETVGSLVPSANAILDSSDPLCLHPAESTHPIVVDTKLSSIDNYFECKTTDGVSYLLQEEARHANMLNKELEDLEQGNKSICEYFTELRILWQNIELMNDWPPISQMTSEIGAWLEAQQKEQNERKLFQFLNGLHSSYITLRSNILMMSPLPSVEEAAAIFQHEEAQRKNYKQSAQVEADTPAFHANQRSDERIPFCEKCKKKGHSVKFCWEIVGYPAGHPAEKYFPAQQHYINPKVSHSGTSSRGYKPRMQKEKFQRFTGKGKGKVAANAMSGGGDEDAAGAITLTTAQFEQLMDNLKGKENASYPGSEDEMEANFAGMTSTTSESVKTKSLEWIIDSGASDHMISNLRLLQNCKQLKFKPKINLPNGDFNTKKIKAFGREERGIYYLLNNDINGQPRITSNCVRIYNSELCNINSCFISIDGSKESEDNILSSCNAPDDICNGLPVSNGNNGDIWLPSKILNNLTPYEVLLNKAPSYDRLRVFGYLAMVYNPSRDKDKDVKFFETVFPCKIRNFGHHLSNLQSEQGLPPNDGVFIEDDLPLSTDNSPTITVCEPSTSPVMANLHTDEPDHRSQRLHLAKPFAGNAIFNTSVVDSSHFSYAVQEEKWVQAMNSELQVLATNNTWVLTDLPKGKKAIGCKWIYKTKYNPDGSIEKHKARLVIQGFRQRYGLDYEETFAPVAKMSTVRALLAIISMKNWFTCQMDVANAFLHGDLAEDVYMKLPPGYFNGVVSSQGQGECDPQSAGKVCKLRKSLYGLKQAPRQWFSKLSQVLLQCNFKQSHADHSLL
ncbi:uncharacterized protein LOC141628387 [Silene latifolia]|uniref:uncharacterized protein LOC141628387 n=1 Tax=Silene latifolia TaxID=37657 RepID=UPI003D7845F3